jgi:hypothetical protein
VSRRHPRTYRRPKSGDDALAGIEGALHEPGNAPMDDAPPRERPSIDYRPIIAVIAIVIFSLALIVAPGPSKGARRAARSPRVETTRISRVLNVPDGFPLKNRKAAFVQTGIQAC